MDVSRTVETELTAEELWRLVSDAEGWASWMVDEATVDVTPAAEGTVVDDGVVRTVRVDRVDVGREVDFTWWPAGEPDAGSSVTLRVLPRAGGSALHVTERYEASASFTATAWDVRAVVLAVLIASLVPTV
jgi:uncharacterized protein YndB with AHSA1/START domain